MKKKMILMVIALVLISIGLVACAGNAQYPSKNISVIIQYSAGGPTDMSVRSMLEYAGRELPKGVSFVPENRTGSGGIVGMTETANAKPDGYHIGVIAVDLLMHKYFGRTELGLDNYIPLAATLADPYALVVASTAEYSTLEEFVSYCQENPGEVVIGNSAAGGAPHLAAIAFEKAFDVEFKHVSYDGSAECITAIVSGEIAGTFTQPAPAVAQLQAGNLEMLTVLSDSRLEAYPDVRTAEEINDQADLSMRGWVVIVAPKGTSDEHVKYLRDIMTKVATDSNEYKEAIRNLGMEPVAITGDALDQMLTQDDAFYKELTSGITIE